MRHPKGTLDAATHARIDASLKQLKTCARVLQPVIVTFSDELHILRRLLYKAKNEHRASLFWRHATEMRRYAVRVEQLSLPSLVDSLRYSFFAEGPQQSSKVLKGPWTHFPDKPLVSSVLRRLGDSLTLIRKMHERLARIYQTFAVAMQSGAFIQLILTLAAIASRMSSLVSELADAVHQTSDTVQDIFVSLHQPLVASQSDSRKSQVCDHRRDVPASVHDDADVGVPISREDHLPTRYDSENASHTERNTVVKRTSEPIRHKSKKKRKRDEIDDIFG
ncbi:hypothetical protein GGX14DRAFT_435188 [Mycena pura]|uniref:Nucleolus and neural progenitor protein-like N-terminal domain-containing protein n=1 Tax=Mycena pura TaxID=153505 RepID=A0AAD6VSN9_9AGAR|nr:hypothetical protein GGX14DRAFT_435188 [Mycena pura]